ncbi:MAG: choice-of-anchor D domain-containing protein [Candidatus Kapaibacterium sp.]
MIRIALLFVILLAFVHVSKSQVLSVFNINSNNYPEISAEMAAFDADGNAIHSITENDVIVTEDGVQLPVKLVDCPEPIQPDTLSVVLVIDQSGSMSGGNLLMAKKAAETLIKSLDPGSECAIVSFDTQNFLIQDFTKDKNLLLQKLQNIASNGGTAYNAALLNPAAGGIPIALGGRYSRNIILITDGHAQGNEQAIITQANQNSIHIHSVIIGLSIPQILRNITNQTGGIYFEKIKGDEEMLASLMMIKSHAQNYKPCKLIWESENCSPMRQAFIEIPKFGLSDIANYDINVNSLAALRADPAYLVFAGNEFGTEKQLTLSATIREVEFTGFGYLGTSVEITNWGGSPPPFKLQPGNPRTVNFRWSFKPGEGTKIKLNPESDACLTDGIYVICGSGIDEALTLTHPNGGEVFLAGSDTLITWEGMPPDTLVNLLFSPDSGANWQPLASSITGSKRDWKAPMIESDKCLMKVEQTNGDRSRKFIIYEPEDSTLAPVAGEWSPSGSEIAYVFDTGKSAVLKINNGYSYEELSTITLPVSNVSSIAWNQAGDEMAVRSPGRIDTYDYAKPAFINNKFLTVSDHFDPPEVNIDWNPSNLYITPSESGIKIQDKADIANEKRRYKNVYWSHDLTRILAVNQNMMSVLQLNGGIKERYPMERQIFIDAQWNYDDSMIVLAINQQGSNNAVSLTVYNSEDLSILSQLKLPEVSHTSIAMHPSKNLLAVSDNDGILIFEILNSTLSLSLNDDIPPVRVNDLEFSPDGNKLFAAYANGRGIIWHLEGEGQSDVSDSVFSIVIPKAEAIDVDMGDVVIGRQRDSTVTALLTNTGKWPVPLDSITIPGSQEFWVSAVQLPDTVMPGESKEVEFTFQPAQPGYREATIRIKTTFSEISAKIYGNGMEPPLSVAAEYLDFGTHWIGSQKDSIEVMLMNTGATSVDITQISISGPDKTQFTIMSGGDPLLLGPGASHSMRLRYSPLTEGRVNTYIRFDYNGAGSPAHAQLFGKGVVPSTYIWLPDTIINPGIEEVSIPLYAKVNLEDQIQLNQLNYTAEVRMNADVFRPSGSFALTNGGSEIVIPVSGAASTSSGPGTIIGELKGQILLPANKVNPMYLESFTWDDANVLIETKDGSITTAVCSFDLRQVKSFTPLDAGIMPNPPGEVLKLKVSSEKSDVRIVILNSAGMNVFNKIYNIEGNSNLEIPLTDWPSGFYIVRVSKPFESVSKKFMIIR